MAENPTHDTASTPSPVVQAIVGYREESKEQRRTRMLQNQDNYDCYHLKQDFSDKKRGQSKEFLAKQATATEQLVSFLGQGLIQSGSWFRIEAEDGVDSSKQVIQPIDMEKILRRQLEKNDIAAYIADSIKLGALGSLMIVKVGGKMAPVASYTSYDKINEKGAKVPTLLRKTRETWQLDLHLVRQEDYYPDPSGDGLYECQDIEMDLHALVKLAKQHPDIYDLKAIQDLQSSTNWEQEQKKARETGQDVGIKASFRKRVTITECWGTIINPETGEVIMENAVAAIANQKFLIRPPKLNPFWHQQSPFIAAPIIRVPKSVWHKAIMDAPTAHNRALNEIYNLQLDSGIQSVFGIKQIREQWLEDPSQVSDGILPGATLRLNSSAPPGAKVLERVDTGSLSQEAATMYAITDKEFQASSLTSDLRMGVLPSRQVKATEIVASNQAITGVFQGIAKNIEGSFMVPMLELAWMTAAQFMNDLSSDEVKALIGDDQALKIANLSPQERFAQTASGSRFKVFGLSMTLNKINDFRKITTLLQTISGSQPLMMLFDQKYDMSKLLGEIIHSLDIDVDKITKSAAQQQAEQAQQQQPPQGPPGPDGQPPQGGSPLNQILQKVAALNGKGGPPDHQSQIPQASAQSAESGVATPKGPMLQGLTNPGNSGG